MALKSSNLTQTNTYEVEVEVDGKTFMEAVAKVFKKQAKKISVPGFRKGKAPRAIIEKIYGEDVFYDDAMQDCYPEALDAAYEFPGDAQVLDGGVLGMELLRFVAGTEKLLILDALKEGGADGKCRRLAGDEVKAHFREKLSAHEIGMQDVLTFLEVTGKPIGEVVVIGAEPKSLEAGLSLSPEMEPRVAEAAAMAAEELSRWGVVLQRKEDHQ